MNINTILVVGAGGFLGTIARYIGVQFIDNKFHGAFPYGTFAVNIIGSFALGFVIGLLYKQNKSADTWKLFFTTGFCGGFTTFSAFTLENVNLMQQKLVLTSLTYTFLSVILGFMAALAGMLLGKMIA